MLEEYDEEIRSPSRTMRTSAVVRVRKTGATRKHGVQFSRINVYAGDGFRRQYCGERREMRDLNYDHVVRACARGHTSGRTS